MTFECKYCKADTAHITMRITEVNGLKKRVVRCLVCQHDSLLFRNKAGSIEVDQSNIPDRKIILPHDLEHRQLRIETEEEEKHHREIDQWLKSDNLKLGWRKTLDKKN